MKRIFALVLGLFTAIPAYADTYIVDPNHTFPSFEISHLGFSTQRGRFNSTTGKITIDTAKKTGSVDISIDVSSIDTGLTKLEEHLKTEDFFDVKKYPTITFKSKKINFNGDKITSVEGDLTLHGVTKPVVLDVNAFNCGVNPINKKNACGANAETTIKRSEYGISAYVPAVGDDVRIIIQIEAFKE